MTKAIIIIGVALGFLIPAFLLGGWVTMLCLGALAHVFSVPELAISFWHSVLVSMIIGLLFGNWGSK